MIAFLAEMTSADWIGVIGSLLISFAYFAVSAERLSATRPMFQILNLVGALLILLSLYYRPNAGAIVIELFWIAIAVWSLLRYMRSR